MISEYFKKKVREDQLKLIQANRELISDVSPVVKFASEIKKEEWAIKLASEIPEVLKELKRMEFLLSVRGELDAYDNSDLLNINKNFQYLANSAKRGAERISKDRPNSDHDPYAPPQSHGISRDAAVVHKSKKFRETFFIILLSFFALAFFSGGEATILHFVVAVLIAMLAGLFSMFMPTTVRFLYIAGGFVAVLIFSVVVSVVSRLLSS